MCVGTEDSVVGLKNVWKYRRMCVGTEDSVVGLKTVWWD